MIVSPPPPDLSARLARLLAALRDRQGLVYLKLGTEAEALDFDEIAALSAIAAGLGPSVPVVGKIGGPEARNDLLQFHLRGAAGFVAPMVESPYALRIFVDAVAAVVPAHPKPLLGINIETALAVDQLDLMLQEPAAASLDFVNVGRSDLAASMGAPAVDHPDVTDATVRVIERVQAAGLGGHVGGCATPATLAPVLARVRPDGFHTRFLAFDNAEHDTVVEALRAEIALLELLAARDPARSALHTARIATTRKRMPVSDPGGPS